MENDYSKINTVTKKILYYILMSGGVIAASIIAPQLPYQILKSYLKKKKFLNFQFQRDLVRLKSRGDIQIIKDDIKITRQGQSRVLRYKLENLKIKKQKIWDKKWRLAVFDIPQIRKKTADFLRQKLNDLGFRQYQKSVFINPYPCRGEIDFVKELLNVSHYVKLITADEIDDQAYFKKKFGL